MAACRDGPEAGMPLSAQGVGRPGDQRRLRADHHQVRAELDGQFRDAFGGARRGRGGPRPARRCPGCQVTRAGRRSRPSARMMACSRPPEPITSMRTGVRLPEQVPQLERLVAARADADARRSARRSSPRSAACRSARWRQVRRSRAPRRCPRPSRRSTRRPASAWWKLGLRHRDLLVPGAVHLIRHADRHLVQPDSTSSLVRK